jgi:hypothetical protein
MTTKVNNLLKRQPFLVQPGANKLPALPLETGFQITIDVSPDGTKSSMNVKGGLNPAVVAMVLTAQLNQLLPNMFAQMMAQASGITDAAGNPVLKMPPPPEKPRVPDTLQVQDMSERPEPAPEPVTE